MIHLIQDSDYKTFEEFAEGSDYADLDDLKEAWNRATKNEDQ